VAKLVVTTCYKPAPAHLERASSLSRRFGVAVIPRVAFEAIDADLIYVVGRVHEEIRDRAGRVCFVQEGMLPTKLGEGSRHPFIRALSNGEKIERVVDCTLGLANDALHAAIALECVVVGVEGSAVLHALLEEGVARFHRKHGARIELRFGDAHVVLSGMSSRSSDVVFLDPMMSRAKKSAPAFELVRQLAVPDRASVELLSEAARVARRRVVLKLGKGAPLPAESPIRFARRERGAHVVYWIHDVS
jgi:hypothetical protein